MNQKAAAAAAQAGAQHRPIPARIGKYEVSGEAGSSAPVRVFHARDRDTGRAVTLKVLTDVADRALLERFRREVAVAANLRSAGMIAVYELGEYVGLPFAAVQHIGGDTLSEAIRTRRPLTLLEKVRIVRQVAEGLQAAHRGGLAYVGVRPSGIALSEQGAVIQDFGVVRASGEEAPAEAYLAPEQTSGNYTPDALCDVYALGVVCYEFLAGTHPFAAGEPGRPAPLREAAPECPEELQRIVERAMDRRRELRYQSVNDFQFDAEPVLRDLQRARAAALLADARRLVDGGELDQAQSLLREIVDLDPDNRKTQRLRTVVRELLQRRTVGPRLEALWREADDEAAARRYDRAAETLESALRLDDANTETRSRLERTRALLEVSRRSALLIAEARGALEAGEFDQARAKVAEAIETDPANPDAAGLLREIGEAIVRRQEEARVEEEVGRAKTLLLTQSFDEAIAVLEALRAERPSATVDHWLAHVRTQQVETERQARFQAQLSEAWFLVAERRFAEALSHLETLAADFGDEPQVAALLDEARRGKDRADAIAEVLETSRRLRGEERFGEALEMLDNAVARYGDELSLVALQRETDEQWRDFQAASAARPVLEEAEWLLGRDRPDLAAEFLREKAAGCTHPEVLRKLADVEALLPEWEKSRGIREALARVAAFEGLGQWSGALTVVEEALAAFPGAPELLDAAARLRGRLKEMERRRRLTRRLEMISRKTEAREWPQALALIEAAQRDFPDSPELPPLLAEARASLRRTECESVVSEVRQCLADGDADQAEEALGRGLEALGEEPALQALREEIAAEKSYLETFRAAQVHFGRRRFDDAEAALEPLAARGRAEAQALLDAVREARAGAEERRFHNAERERALALIREGRVEEAADLLGKLLALFPGNPLLERDLASIRQCPPVEGPGAAPEQEAAPGPAAPAPVESAADGNEEAAVVLLAAAAAPEAPPAPPAPVEAAAPEPAAPRRPVWLWPAAAGMLLLAGAGAWWYLGDGSAPAARAAQSPRDIPAAAAPEAGAGAAEASRAEPPVSAPAPREPRPSAPARPFRLPSPALESETAQAVIAPPPEAAVAPGPSAPALPAVMGAVAPPPRPAAPAREAPQPAADRSPTPQPRIGGEYREVVPISRPSPTLPEFARTRGIYGTVSLEATVNERGAVTDIRIVNGHPVLARAAADAVRRWRFQPATLNGRPVEVRLPVRVQFTGGR